MLRSCFVLVIYVFLFVGCSSSPVDNSQKPLTADHKKQLQECKVAENARNKRNAKNEAEAKAKGTIAPYEFAGECCSCMEVRLRRELK